MREIKLENLKLRFLNCRNNLQGRTGLAVKCAFTLAEVLIVLAIIGIVASITIPAIINSYQKKQTLTRLKASYSSLAQSLKMAETEYGDRQIWNIDYNDNDAFVTKYLKPYMKIEKYENTKPTYYAADNEIYPNLTSADSYLISNGAVLYIYCSVEYKVCFIYIDINGFNPPNKLGRDLFIFDFRSSVGLRANDDSNPDNINACYKGRKGNFCAARIMKNGWQIPDDYPWQ